MKYRLPVLAEKTVQHAFTARTELATRIERELQSLAFPLTCTKGCHHCCYYPVAISVFEATSLFRWLDKERIWNKSLRETFEETAKKTTGLAFDIWMLSRIPCPLLDPEGLCMAYERRPFICRVTASTSDPYNCHPHRVANETGPVPRREYLERLERAEAPLQKRYEVGQLKMPLARAILLAERVCKGEIDLEDVGKFIWLDLKTNG